jgi:hypothetical protein
MRTAPAQKRIVLRLPRFRAVLNRRPKRLEISPSGPALRVGPLAAQTPACRPNSRFESDRGSVFPSGSAEIDCPQAPDPDRCRWPPHRDRRRRVSRIAPAFLPPQSEPRRETRTTRLRLRSKLKQDSVRFPCRLDIIPFEGFLGLAKYAGTICRGHGGSPGSRHKCACYPTTSKNALAAWLKARRVG